MIYPAQERAPLKSRDSREARIIRIRLVAASTQHPFPFILYIFFGQFVDALAIRSTRSHCFTSHKPEQLGWRPAAYRCCHSLVQAEKVL